MGSAGPLQDRVALVTGAAGAIGAAIARSLTAAGARVVIADLETAEPAADGSPEVVPMACDVGDADAVDALVECVVERFGSVDVLVNNAGVFGTLRKATKIEPEAWDRDLQINLSGPFYLTRSVLPHMLERSWGRIINISSISSGGGFKQASYAASKAGLLGLTSTVAMEFAAAGITCNAVLPGLICTPKVAAAPQDIVRQALRTIPAGRTGTVEDVAELVTFLATPAADYITGASIPLDGGAMLLQLSFGRRSSLRVDQPEHS